MANRSGQWTRRQFSQALAASAAGASLFARHASALRADSSRGIAFAASSPSDPLDGTIHVFRVSGSNWQLAQSIKTPAPAHLSAHPTRPLLYVVHDVDAWEDLPRGAVSAHSFDPATGTLTHAGTQPLSLAATYPKHALVTAGGASLFVSAQEGGIYNLLPIQSDGSLGPVAGIRKELGLQEDLRTKIAEPRHAVLHPEGYLLAADSGQETITRFDLQQGTIAPQSRKQIHPGTGPSQLAVSPCGRRVYAMDEAHGAISVHNLASGEISPALQTYSGTGGNACMLMHPSGRALIVSGSQSIAVLLIDKHTGRLSAHTALEQRNNRGLYFNPAADQLIETNPATGQITARSFDSISGVLGAPKTVAQVNDISGLHFHSA